MRDLANEAVVGQSIDPDNYTATVNGSSVDCQDCGPEITSIFNVGDNPGDDTSIAVKLQESADDSTWSDISGATHTAVAGDTENQLEAKTFFNRTERYVRQVATVTGTSPVIDMSGTLICPKKSY